MSRQRLSELPSELRSILLQPLSVQRRQQSVTRRFVATAASATLKRPPFAFRPPDVRPWSATLRYADFRGLRPVEHAENELIKQARLGNAKETLQLLSVIRQDLAVDGLYPSLHVYKMVLTALAVNGLYTEACQILETIGQTPGLMPDTSCFNLLLRAATVGGRGYQDVLDVMKVAECKPDVYTYQQLLSYHYDQKSLDECLALFEEMEVRHIEPTLMTLEMVARLAASLQNATEAFPLLKRALVLQTDEDRVRRSTLLAVLEVCAEEYFMKGIHFILPILISDPEVILHEGLLLLMLNAAARKGDVRLAQECLSYMLTVRIPAAEHHHAALIEAFCRNRQLEAVLLHFPRMLEDGVTLSPHTLDPLVQSISLGNVRPSPTEEQIKTSLDDFHTLLVDTFDREPSCVHIGPINAFIKALIRSGDLHRALLTFKHDFKKYNLKPDVNTYNHLLYGCTNSGARSLAIDLFQEMESSGIKPDETTHERMISIYCWFSEIRGDYMPAFGHLEQIKSLGRVPRVDVYKNMADRLDVEGDQERLELLLIEAKSIHGEKGRKTAKRRTPIQMPVGDSLSQSDFVIQPYT